MQQPAGAIAGTRGGTPVTFLFLLRIVDWDVERHHRKAGLIL